MLRNTLASLFLALTLAACSKAGPAADALASQTLLITPQDLVTIRSGSLPAGPSSTGSIQPQRRADLRAEVSAVVLQVLKVNGDQGRRGALLVRLDDPAIRDSLSSAEDAVRASSQSFDQAERQMQRL